MLIAFSTLVLILIAVGLKYRRRAKIHIPMMVAAFVIDLVLLLYIELSRHAIQTVGENIMAPANSELLFFHVTVSTLTLVLYIVQIVTGIMLFRNIRPNIVLHRGSAYLFVACRLLNYGTSFFVPMNY